MRRHRIQRKTREKTYWQEFYPRSNRIYLYVRSNHYMWSPQCIGRFHIIPHVTGKPLSLEEVMHVTRTMFTENLSEIFIYRELSSEIMWRRKPLDGSEVRTTVAQLNYLYIKLTKNERQQQQKEERSA